MKRLILGPLLIVLLGIGYAMYVDSSDNGHTDRRPPTRTAPATSAARPPVAEGQETAQPPKPYKTARERGAGKAAPAKDTAPPFSLESAGATPQAAVRAYAEQFTDWNGKTMRRQFRRLAALSSGNLADQNRNAARDRETLAMLKRDGSGNTGQILGVEVPDGTPVAHGFNVTVREHSYSRSAAPSAAATRGVYVGEVRKSYGGWRIAQWIPRS